MIFKTIYFLISVFLLQEKIKVFGHASFSFLFPLIISLHMSLKF